MDSKLYWSLLVNKDWSLHLAATAEGLCYVSPANRPFEELAEWARSRFPGSELVQDDRMLEPYANELDEYLHGTRRSFSGSRVFKGTLFQQRVWDALCRIPYGETRSYSDIAAAIGKPSSVRAVGAAIGANPILITVPCHRVIGKNGALTGFRGGLDMKTRLLQLEQG
ncbi:methylated-DNA--[protein]-cysteine S-methyltransferase [Gorillibacterium timonense]|uniref:methylated-DNA--[protein]-cysteine S-methyltransferase n=1 Tax=Gorillibacterium timonense TaxID=1689269 RepID=UPI00071C6BDE|nr:methylated-DNA--[protein]-cysteine S-methyltransferase [Gorillibacterium timonense]